MSTSLLWVTVKWTNPWPGQFQSCCALGTHWPAVLGPMGLTAAGNGDSIEEPKPVMSHLAKEQQAPDQPGLPVRRKLFLGVLLSGCRLPLLPWRSLESSQRPFSGRWRDTVGHASALWRALHAPGCSSAWQGGAGSVGCGDSRCACAMCQKPGISWMGPSPEPWASDPGTLPGNRNQQEL